jgi:hypothetical protein
MHGIGDRRCGDGGLFPFCAPVASALGRDRAGSARCGRRNRFDVSALPVKDKLAYPVIEPGSWVMERKMLLTIKERAERLARTGHGSGVRPGSWTSIR